MKTIKNNAFPKMSKKIRKFSALVKLIINSFFGQPIGIIIALIAPLTLFVIIPYLINNIESSSMDVEMSETLKKTIPQLLLLPSLIIGNLGLPITFSTLKENRIMKKMCVVGITPMIYIFSFVVVFFFLTIFSTLLIYLIGFAIFQKDLPYPSGFAFLIPWMFLILVSIFVGLLISSFVKSQALSFAIGIATFLPIAFLSGVLLPDIEGWIKYLARVFPHSWLVSLYKASWHENLLYTNVYSDGTYLFEIIGKQGEYPIIKPIERKIDPRIIENNTWDTLLVYLYPSISLSAQNFIITKKFQWE